MRRDWEPPILLPPVRRARIVLELEGGEAVTYELNGPEAVAFSSDFGSRYGGTIGSEELFGHYEPVLVPQSFPAQVAFAFRFPLSPRPGFLKITRHDATINRLPAVTGAPDAEA